MDTASPPSSRLQPAPQPIAPALRRGLTIRTRLIVVAVLSALLAALPTGWLVRHVWEDRSQAQRAWSSLQANRAWQAALATVRAHREAGSALLGQAQARPALQAAAAQWVDRLQAVHDALPASLRDAAQQQAAAALQERWSALVAMAAQQPPRTAPWLAAHRAFVQQVQDEITRLNTASQLFLERDPGLQYLVRAGLQDAPRMSDALSELSALALAAAVDDPSAIAATMDRYLESASAMRLHLALASDGDAGLAAQVHDAQQQLQDQRTQVQALVQQVVADVNFPLATMTATLAQATVLQTQLTVRVIDLLSERMTARMRALDRAALAVLLAMAVGLGVALALLLHTVRAILLPLRQAMQVTECIARGDLSVSVPTGRPDEMGRVLEGLAAMRQRLHAVVRKLMDASHEIRSASGEVARGNQDLSGRTEQAASSVVEAAHMLEKIGSAAQQGVTAAQRATALAQAASQATQGGDAAVASVVHSMQQIQQRSRRIGEITGVIDGIAFQTNILALNAAVEAARAGEHGRGFAVVASEVRSLAQRAGDASREIRQLIEGTTAHIQQGSRLAEDAGAAMAQIGQGIHAATAAITEVEHAVDGQAVAIAQVHASLGALDQITQQNAALVEQSAAAATSMLEQTHSMHALVDLFRIDAAAPAATAQQRTAPARLQLA